MKEVHPVAWSCCICWQFWGWTGVLVIFSTRAIFCLQLTSAYKNIPTENTVNNIWGGIRAELSCVGLALGWGVRNVYFLESDRRKSPYLRGNLNSQWWWCKSRVNNAFQASPLGTIPAQCVETFHWRNFRGRYGSRSFRENACSTFLRNLIDFMWKVLLEVVSKKMFARNLSHNQSVQVRNLGDL